MAKLKIIFLNNDLYYIIILKLLCDVILFFNNFVGEDGSEHILNELYYVKTVLKHT